MQPPRAAYRALFFLDPSAINAPTSATASVPETVLGNDDHLPVSICICRAWDAEAADDVGRTTRDIYMTISESHASHFRPVRVRFVVEAPELDPSTDRAAWHYSLWRRSQGRAT